MCLLYDWHHPPIKPLIHFKIATKHYSARISPICLAKFHPNAPAHSVRDGLVTITRRLAGESHAAIEGQPAFAARHATLRNPKCRLPAQRHRSTKSPRGRHRPSILASSPHASIWRAVLMESRSSHEGTMAAISTGPSPALAARIGLTCRPASTACPIRCRRLRPKIGPCCRPKRAKPALLTVAQNDLSAPPRRSWRVAGAQAAIQMIPRLDKPARRARAWPDL